MALQWHKVKAAIALRVSDSPELGSEFRLFLMAVGNAGPGGHAHFPEGLGKALTKFNRSTGEVGAFSEKALRNMLKRLAVAGLISPESTLKCVVLNADVVDVGTRPRSQPCPEHGHWMHWSSGGWVEFDPNLGAVLPFDRGTFSSQNAV